MCRGIYRTIFARATLLQSMLKAISHEMWLFCLYHPAAILNLFPTVSCAILSFRPRRGRKLNTAVPNYLNILRIAGGIATPNYLNVVQNGHKEDLFI